MEDIVLLSRVSFRVPVQVRLRVLTVMPHTNGMDRMPHCKLIIITFVRMVLTVGGLDLCSLS
jgi:hypothetical protein